MCRQGKSDASGSVLRLVAEVGREPTLGLGERPALALGVVDSTWSRPSRPTTKYWLSGCAKYHPETAPRATSPSTR
jgi:hypothetical protein